jgi:hypothetical protein
VGKMIRYMLSNAVTKAATEVTYKTAGLLDQPLIPPVTAIVTINGIILYFNAV